MYAYSKHVHNDSFVADLHADTLIWSTLLGYDIAKRHVSLPFNPIYNHVDAPRLKDGGIDFQVFGLTNNYWYHPKQSALAMCTAIDEAVKTSDHLGWARNADELCDVCARKKVGIVLALQGVHQLEGRLDNLAEFYSKGVRSVSLTHFNSSDAAPSNTCTHGHDDLKPYGLDLIKRMDELGMIVDCAHVAERAAHQAIEVSHNPVIISHTACRALRDISRNTSDDLIKAIAQKGGIMGIMYQLPFLTTNPFAGPKCIVEHIDHVCELVGPDYVALGSDFDGFIIPPFGIRDTRDVVKITNGMVMKGYKLDDIRKILGGNVLRVYEQVCG